MSSRLNDNIEPIPDYVLDINEKTKVITLTVKEGLNKPYLYKSQAYMRKDASTFPVDRAALKKLVLEGNNMSYEDLNSKSTNLEFEVLSEMMKEKLGIENFNKDILASLGLYNKKQGYNKAAELLADENSFPGIDIIRFGDSINVIKDREHFDNMSILAHYHLAIEQFERYYQYEEIQGECQKREIYYSYRSF